VARKFQEENLSMQKQKLIIDTDCGSDDAMAIAMALRDERYEILFFSTCSGNVIADQAAINTLTTIEMAGTYEPPVYLGCREMLLKPATYGHETHGNDGMGDIGLVPKRLSVTPGNAILKIIETLEQADAGEIEIITLGTLTNIALAMRVAPDAMRRVKRISIMGSAGLGTGNVSPAAEFNIWEDPDSAKIVLEFGVPILLVGWDACLGEAMLDEAEIARIRNSGPLGQFAIDCNKVLMEMNAGRFGAPCLDMADPAAMAAALYPECIETCADYYCEVDTSNGISNGAVLVDVYGFSGKAPNAAVCSKLKADLYKDYIYRTLGA
jgi:purine nucleosidase